VYLPKTTDILAETPTQTGPVPCENMYDKWETQERKEEEEKRFSKKIHFAN
jgi:hypothetical protein